MSDDDSYAGVIRELGIMHDAWRTQREVVNRAIIQLNHEVIAVGARLDRFDQTLRNVQFGVLVLLMAMVALMAYIAG